MSSASYFHASNVFYIADRRARPCDGQAARLPRTARQGAEVESGENAAPMALPATRDAAYRKEVGAPPALPPSLVATIAHCPTMTADGRQVYLCLGGMAWRDELGWRWTNSRSPRIHDIWNPALIAALDERATVHQTTPSPIWEDVQ